jgi:DNA repair exonuclease SbcCD ATPase subunit
MESERPQRPPLASSESQKPAAAPSPATGDDELQGVIADVERQLASLRTYRAQHEETRTKWQAVEKELARRAAEVSTQVAQLAAEREGVSQAQAALKHAEADLAGRAQAIEKDFKSLSEEQRKATEAAENREADFAGRRTTLEQREQRLLEQTASISKQREQAQAMEAELAKRERSLADHTAEVERRKQEMATLEKRAAQAEAAAKQSGESLARAQNEAKQGTEQLSERSRELEGVRKELARSGEAQGELMRSLSEREKTLQSLKASLVEATAQSEKSASALTESERRVADFKRQVIERDGRIQDLSAKLSAATGKLREVSHGIQEQAELIGQARELEAQLNESTEKVASLEAELAEARAQLGEHPESVPDPAVLAERETLRLRAESLEEQLLDTRRQLESASDEVAELHDRLEKGAGPSRGGGSFGDVPEEVGEAIVIRWRRLRLMRTILREQADKLRQAGEAVRARYDEVEKVAQERQTLARERASFAASKASIQPKAAPRSTMSTLAASCYAAVAVAALAGLSWAIGGQIAPATYEARVTINADGQGTAPSPSQLAEWQKYHESLLKDPALTELAAERMGRRGIASLATPGALMSRLEADVNTQSPSAGQLTINLRGKGSAETVRVLDTYVTALVSQANADRERRTDGLATVISEAPSPGSGPIEDPRLIYSGITFALSAGFSLAVGGVALRRLSTAKERLERMPEEEETPEGWDKPPQDYAR